MAEVLLDNTEVLGPAIEFTGITMPDLMGCYTGRCIVAEYVLNRPGGDILVLLTDKKRTFNPVADKLPDRFGGIVVKEHHPRLVSFPPDLDGMLFKIDISDINTADSETRTPVA